MFADEMYLKTDGDVVEDPEITKHEVAMLEADEEIHSTFVQGSKLAADEASRRGTHIAYFFEKTKERMPLFWGRKEGGKEGGREEEWRGFFTNFKHCVVALFLL